MKKPTMQHIANRLNISKNAVSLALSGKPGVGERTRHKVFAVAAEIGYPIRNRTYQNSHEAHMIGLVAKEDIYAEYDLVGEINLHIEKEVFEQASLNGFIGLGKEKTNSVRRKISQLFSADNGHLRDNLEHREIVLHPFDKVEMMMPVQVGDYTDFYSSIEHATNVGTMFRDPNNAL
jgi:transcriptional regulator with XRE-family HTH domain